MLEIVGNYCEIPWEDALLRRNPDLITEKLKSEDRAANFDRSASWKLVAEICISYVLLVGWMKEEAYLGPNLNICIIHLLCGAHNRYSSIYHPFQNDVRLIFCYNYPNQDTHGSVSTICMAFVWLHREKCEFSTATKRAVWRGGYNMQLHVTYKLLLQSNIKRKDPGSFIISTKIAHSFKKNYILKLRYACLRGWGREEEEEKRRNFQKRGEKMSKAEAQKRRLGALEHDPTRRSTRPP